MNARIQELIEQSYDEVPHERDWDAVTMVFNKEKFAELIVKECAELCDINDREQGDILREHFGVETEIEVEYCPKCNDEWSGTSCGIPGCGWITGEDDE
jgi:hypothetical protein